MKQISVNEAIRIGRRNSSLWFAIPMYVTVILACLTVLVSSISFYYIFLSLPIGILLSYYFTTRYLYKWQGWAFRKVRNVHELKRKAEKCGLIPTFERKLFPPSMSELLAPESLTVKFSHPDVVPDDSAIPPVFEIYYSKSYNRIELIGWSLGFFGMTWAIILLLNQNELRENLMMQGALGCIWLITLLFIVENFMQLRTYRPVITLTQEGIWVNRRLFTKADVKDIEIVDGKQKTLKVKFYGTIIPYLIDLNDKDVDVDTFEDAAEAFLRRWKA